jgi:1,4-dihydroxy-2-naphthoate octaprenyltransferase
MNIKPWILATRPKTLTASIGPVILGSSIALYNKDSIDYFLFVIILINAVLLQIGTNLVNDYYDSERGIDGEDRLGPKRVTQAGLIDSKKVKTAFISVFIIAFLLGIYLMVIGGTPIIITGVLSIFFAYAYTGGPIPLSYIGLGEILALVFFGPVPVWGTYFLLTGEHSLAPVIAGLGPGFIAATLMSINNLRDIKSDSKTSKKTIAVLIGEKNARLMTILLVVFSSFVPFLYSSMYLSKWVILATLTTYPFTKTWMHISKAPISEELNNCLANTGKYLLLFCLVFSASIFIK